MKHNNDIHCEPALLQPIPIFGHTSAVDKFQGSWQVLDHWDSESCLVQGLVHPFFYTCLISSQIYTTPSQIECPHWLSDSSHLFCRTSLPSDTSLRPTSGSAKMHLTRLAPLTLLLASNLHVAAWTPADTSQTDVLVAQGLQNLAYYEIQGNVQANCSLANAAIRSEWYVL